MSAFGDLAGGGKARTQPKGETLRGLSATMAGERGGNVAGEERSIPRWRANMIPVDVEGAMMTLLSPVAGEERCIGAGERIRIPLAASTQQPL